MTNFLKAAALVTYLSLCSLWAEGPAIKQPRDPALLGAVPAGWQVVEAEGQPPLVRKIVLKDGSEAEVKVRPFVLKPIADNQTKFSVRDPSFQKKDGFYQPLLEAAIQRQEQALREGERDMEVALNNLRQLLLTLPEAEPEPKTESE
ncbi:MAG: hypothetical protein Q7Q71_13150 [Verrucomicrobiota bacterium JB023]|nr:hypothetical protein [Verrucomicrobiota bacterium JB023]